MIEPARFEAVVNDLRIAYQQNAPPSSWRRDFQLLSRWLWLYHLVEWTRAIVYLVALIGVFWTLGFAYDALAFLGIFAAVLVWAALLWAMFHENAFHDACDTVATQWIGVHPKRLGELQWMHAELKRRARNANVTA